MVQVEFKAEQALLRISFRGHVSVEEVREHFSEVVAALEHLAPGFRLLTDLSELDSMDYACAPEVEATMDLLREKGVGLVVRVVPDPHKDIGFKVMSFFHYGHAVPVLTVESPTEALAKLSAK